MNHLSSHRGRSCVLWCVYMQLLATGTTSLHYQTIFALLTMSNISDYEDGMYPGILMIVEDPKNKHQPFTKYERHPGSTTWTRKQAGPPAGHLEDPLEEHDSIATPFKSKWSKGKSAGQLTDPFADLGLGPPPPPPSNDDGVDFKNLTTLEKRILGMCSRTTHR